MNAAQPLWSPSAQSVAQCNLTAFINVVGAEHSAVVDYDSLYQWSIDHTDQFWQALWDYCGVISSQPYESILTNSDAMPGASWFEGARLNFAENLLRYRDETVAFIGRTENGDMRKMTYSQVYQEVVRCSQWLKSLGVKKGDRIAGYMSNGPEAVIAMLATTSLGAIWSSCSPDFGVKGVLERFTQIQPRVLFAIDGYQYNGKPHRVVDSIAAVSEAIASIEQVIIVPFLQSNPDISSLSNAVLYNEFETNETEMQFEQLPFDHPLYILYSSGTTGKPKCIVHSAGGTLLQHLKEHQLHTDVKRQDTLFYFTTCGWMMWNWLVSGLASGCSLVLYDGSPFYPNKNAMWDMVDQCGITVFGTSARYIAACSKSRLAPRERSDLSTLRAILSTGSPLVAESFDYVYQKVKSDVMLSSISGGTDIVSCFVLGNPMRPVYRGEIQGRGLGLAVDVYEDGKPVRQQRAELVCTKPFPCMPIGFWNEPDNKRYQEAYFERFEGVWAQGDYAEITANDGLIIYGRSDAVLNPGGVRIGTAEIYRQVEKVDEVLESLCIGQQWDGDVRIVLFVMLRQGVELDQDLKNRIRQVIRDNTTPRHLPRKIIAVTDIPRTLSGKIVELAVRNIVHGDAVKNTDALANPEALAYFRDLEELQRR